MSDARTQPSREREGGAGLRVHPSALATERTRESTTFARCPGPAASCEVERDFVRAPRGKAPLNAITVRCGAFSETDTQTELGGGQRIEREERGRRLQWRGDSAGGEEDKAVPPFLAPPRRHRRDLSGYRRLGASPLTDARSLLPSWSLVLVCRSTFLFSLSFAFGAPIGEIPDVFGVTALRRPNGGDAATKRHAALSRRRRSRS